MLYCSCAKLRAIAEVSPWRQPGWSKIGSWMPLKRSTAPAAVKTSAAIQKSREAVT